MNQQELNALADLLNRTPLTLAERFWVQALFARLQQELQFAEETARPRKENVK